MSVESMVFGLYKKYCSSHYKKYQEMEVELEKIKNTPKPVVKDMYATVFDTIRKDNVEILGIERNLRKEYVVVCKAIIQEKLTIMLYSPTYLTINKHPMMWGNVETDRIDGRPYMHVEDLSMIDNNIGNGSICMKYFVLESLKVNAKEMRGILSLVDMGHFDRSTHFYKKHGFEVTMDSDNRSGRIKKILIDENADNTQTTDNK